MTDKYKPNIRELAEKAGLSYILLPSSPYIEQDLAKFARLIAEECAVLMENNDFEGSSIGDVIRNSFGLECNG